MMIRRAFDSLGRKDPVFAISRFRSLRNRHVFEEHGVVTQACDLGNRASVTALPEAPTVFYLVGVKFGTSNAPELLKEINVEMPRNIADRFRQARIVAYSTGNVYPFVRPDSGGATEETRPEPVGDYAASCLAREQALAEVSKLHGTKVTLIRLSYSVEFRYGVLVDIAQRVLQGKPVDVTTGHVNVIWQTDAIAHCIQALDLASSPAVPINVTGSEILSVRWLAQRFGELLKRPVQITGHEAETAWLSNAARSHRLFGLPPTPVPTMMAWVAAWLTNGGPTWRKPTSFERRDGRF
jgi:nucleoside-diphosphate-sugar epimerase